MHIVLLAVTLVLMLVPSLWSASFCLSPRHTEDVKSTPGMPHVCKRCTVVNTHICGLTCFCSCKVLLVFLGKSWATNMTHISLAQMFHSPPFRLRWPDPSFSWPRLVFHEDASPRSKSCGLISKQFTATSLGVTHPCAEGGIRQAPMWNLQQRHGRTWHKRERAFLKETHLPHRMFYFSWEILFYEGLWRQSAEKCCKHWIFSLAGELPRRSVWFLQQK